MTVTTSVGDPALIFTDSLLSDSAPSKKGPTPAPSKKAWLSAPSSWKQILWVYKDPTPAAGSWVPFYKFILPAPAPYK